MSDPLENLPTADLVQALRHRGYRVVPPTLRPQRRAVFEHRTGDQWERVGAWRVSTEDMNPDGVLAEWVVGAVAGDYRCAVYEGSELVDCSQVRTLT